MINDTPDDAHAHHQHPGNALPMVPLPTDLWQAVFQFVDTNPKALGLVSRQFLRAWRAGVIGVYVHIPSHHHLGFLLEEKFNHFPNLKFVDLNDNDAYVVRDPSARAAALAQPGLSLRLTLSSQIRPPEATVFLKEHPQLAALVTHVTTFSGKNPFEETWELVNFLPNLSSLRLTCCADLSDDALRRLASLPALTQLSMVMCKPFTGEGLDALMGQHTRLQSLSVFYCKLQGEHLAHLAQSQRLRKLALVGCVNLKPQDLIHLGQCTALNQLCIRENPQIDGAGLDILAQQLPQLETLDISYCTGLDDDTLWSLAPLHQLSYINLLGCPQITLEAVHQLAGVLPEITEISAGQLISSTGDRPDPPVNAKRQPVVITDKGRHL